MNIKFNDELLFGVATASTQIEGGDTNNDWYKWTIDGKNTKDGTNSYRANRHWENYKEHIDLMKDLNIQVYRMSIEWSRVEPEEGIFDKDAIEHYRDEISYLLSNGIKPLVTLHHFSNPIWFDELGGFKNKDANKYFIPYVEYVVKHLKDLVDEWCTINEPNIYASGVYLLGNWIMQEKSFKAFSKAMTNLAICHIEAYKLIHSIQENAKVGFAHNVQLYYPKHKWNLFHRLETRIYDKGFNLSIYNAMAKGVFKWPLHHKDIKGDYLDYIGINFYNTNLVSGFKYRQDSKWPTNELGWGIVPDSLRVVVERYHNFSNKDVWITENGTCDSKDAFRSQYLIDHLCVIADFPYLKRYYHWTFMDNFEWAEGESAKFGLVEYNYDDHSYQPRKSAYLYKEIIENHEISDTMVEQYNIHIK